MKLNGRELSKYFEVSEVTIHNWRKEGMPVQVRPGIRKPIYDVEECEEWLQKRDEKKLHGKREREQRMKDIEDMRR